MNKKVLFTIIVAIALLLFWIFRSKLNLQGSGAIENSQLTSSTKVVKTNNVVIKNYAFSPAKIAVKKGTTVLWENYDLVPHTVTSDDKNQNGPNSNLLSKGKTYSFTFSKAGTYSYHCTPHPYMKAEVIVAE